MTIPDAWRRDLERRLSGGQRVILGLAGTPGAGKSSLAEALGESFGVSATVVPMDGFHLANVELARLGLSGRKGAPQTFDVHGYVALLRRIRTAGSETTVYAPVFRRDIEEPIAGAIAVLPQHRLVITEGNYLLLNHAGWASVAPLLDLTWYVDIDAAARHARLVARHMHFGRSRTEAEHWIASNDALNADLVETSKDRADRIVSWPM